MSSSSGPAARVGLRRTLALSTADGICCNGMVAAAETYFCAFLLAAAKSETSAGLIGSVPLLIGSLLQLASPRLMQIIGSHRRWVVGCALVQVAALCALVAYALRGSVATVGVFALVALYFGAAQASGTGWAPWIERLVPARVRPRYFAFRNRCLQLALMVALFGSGALLDRVAQQTTALTAFACVFAFAAMSRLVSAFLMAQHPDVATDARTTKTLSIAEFAERLRVREDGRIMRYVLSVQVTVYVAGPYFAPFMLQKLAVSYGDFMLLTAAMFAGKIIVYPICAHAIRTMGPRKLLWLGGLGLMLLPLPWMLSDRFSVIFAAQLIGGLAWGAFETGTFFLYLKHVPNDERTAMMSMFNVCNAVMMVLGSSVGAAVLGIMGATKTAYLMVFALSTLGRIATSIVLRRIEPTPVHHAVPIAFALVRPSLDRPRVIVATWSRRVRVTPPPNRPQLRPRRGAPRRRSA